MIIISRAANPLGALESERIVDALFDDEPRRLVARMMLSGPGMGPDRMDEIRQAVRTAFPRAMESSRMTSLDAMMHDVKVSLDAFMASDKGNG